MDPVRLGPHRPRSFYAGSGAIDRWRHIPAGSPDAAVDGRRPEDWIASTTAQFSRAPHGLSRLPDGRLLVETIGADPAAWLGPGHLAAWGPDPRLLVKLLDAGQRLPVHVHPGRDFAARHLLSPYGKTEAWIILDAGPDATVDLGFSRDVEAAELAAWTRTQDVDALRAAVNRIPVTAGDTVLVPAGLPHAIGAGILLAELQEPSDFSIFLEWAGFDLDGPAEGHLGLGYDLALGCVNPAAVTADRISGLRSVRGESAFPAEADDFFRARRVAAGPDVVLDAGYGVLLVLAGSGRLGWAAGVLDVAAGETVLVPWAAGDLTLGGEDLVVLHARPPLGPDR